MKNRQHIPLLCILSVALTVAVASARQNGSLFGGQKAKQTFNEQLNAARPKRPVSTVTKLKATHKSNSTEPKDTACYLALTKRYGWYYGIGPKLTKAEAARVPCCFQLTEKDSLGHYAKIEAVNGSGMYTPEHGLETYLSEDRATAGDHRPSDLGHLLHNVVQWRLHPDSDMRRSSMESGYDAAGNLIYTYISTQFNDTTSVGHYVDSFGEPVALLAGDNEARYVQVDYDTLGYERCIRYLDKDAYFKRNLDGAYMQRKNYDENGNTVRLISCAMTGIPIKDDWGNCGWAATYNERGQLQSKTYLDESMRPMKMPPRRAGSTDVVTRRFDYDDAHRMVRQSYFLADGDKDVTKNGIHSVERQYDKRGNLLVVTTRDKDGRLCGNDDGIAITEHTYTAAGEPASTLFRDKNNLLKNDAEDICLYLGKNKYRTTNGVDTIPVYTETTTDGCTTITDYTTDCIHILRTDNLGRETESAYYNLKMEPKLHPDYDYIWRRTTYSKSGTSEIKQTDTYAYGDTVRAVTTTDTKEHTRKEQTFSKGMLLSSFGQTLSDDLETVTGQYGFDAFGNIARSHLEDALYYKVKSSTTYRGATSYMAGKNEYDEPSYVAESESLSSNIYCTKLFDKNGNVVLLDEDNKQIDDIKDFRNSLKRVYCIEVMTPRAIELGLRSGDIIVRYGEFYYPEPVPGEWVTRNQLQMETYLTRNTPKPVLLLRFFPVERTHKLISLKLPAGTEEDLGFIIQTVYYTKAETDRYNSIVDEYLTAHNIDRDKFVTDDSHYGDNDVCLIRPYKVLTGSMVSWRNGLRQDAIIIGVLNRKEDGSIEYTSLADGFNKLWDRVGTDCNSTTIYYTADGTNLKTVTLPGTRSAVSYTSKYTPTVEYENLVKLAQSIVPVMSYTPEEAYEFLVKETQPEISFHSVNGDDLFDAFLEQASAAASNDSEFDFSGATEVYVLSFNKSSNTDDQDIIKSIIESIDFSDYIDAKTEGFSTYLKASSANQSQITQLIIYEPESSFVILKGVFDIDLSEIK